MDPELCRIDGIMGHVDHKQQLPRRVGHSLKDFVVCIHTLRF